MRTFASDNWSAVDPRVMEYLRHINTGHAKSYTGDDTVTQAAQAEFVRIFGSGARVIFVPSGTGANILGLKLLLQRPYEAVITSQVSHIFGEETGAVAANVGAHIFTLPHQHGKINPAELEREIALRVGEGSIHLCQKW